MRRFATAGLVGGLALAACSNATTGATSTSTSVVDTTTTTAAPTTTYVPDGVDPESACLERAAFPDPTTSPYRLPFRIGGFHPVTQSYCRADGGHRYQLSYDFAMPIGTDVLAARGGFVRNVREDSPDTGRGDGEHNFVFVEHDDGTVAFYAHLMQDGVVVEIGDSVEAGDVLGLSGNSGLSSHPHLHFGVYSDWPPTEGYDVPVSFSNAIGRLDPNGGLIEGLVYEAG